MQNQKSPDRTFYVYWLYFWNTENIYNSGYVGITDNLKDRFCKHRKRFGNFKYMIVFTGTQAQAFALEHHLRPKPNIGLNKAIGGLQFGVYSPMTGRNHTPETIEKIRKSNLGKHRTNTRINFKHTDETKALMSQQRKGRKHTPEAKAKVVAALTGSTVSPETCARISASNTGKKATKETRKAMSDGKWAKYNIDMSNIKMLKDYTVMNGHSVETMAKADAEPEIK